MESTFAARDGRGITLRPAAPADRLAASQLLTALELPTEGITEWWHEFIVAECDGALIGLAGVELYGPSALLRSVAVHPSCRDSGVGRALVDRALDHARRRGAIDVYLLTTTAEHYFPRLGFTPIARAEVPEGVQTSVEFRGACPASAIVMHCGLSGSPVDRSSSAVRSPG